MVASNGLAAGDKKVKATWDEQQNQQDVRSDADQQQKQQDLRSDTGRDEPMTGEIKGSSGQLVQQSLMAVDRARRSMDQGNRQEAIKHLEQAKRYLNESHEQITGRAPQQAQQDLAADIGAERSVVLVDPVDQKQVVTKERTRQYQDYVIVFNSEANAQEWDKFSQSEKQQKFRQASDKGGQDLRSDQQQQQQQRPVNSVCPVDLRKLDPTLDGQQTRTYNGEQVSFGSEDSAKKWDQMSDAEKQTRLDAVRDQKAQAAVKADIDNYKDPVSGERLSLDKTYPDSQTRSYKGNKIGFASQENAKKWDQLSEQEKAQKFSACRTIDVQSDIGQQEKSQLQEKTQEQEKSQERIESDKSEDEWNYQK
jgi:hypothetical protein